MTTDQANASGTGEPTDGSRLPVEQQAVLNGVRLWTRGVHLLTGHQQAAHDDRCTDPHDPVATPCPVSDYLPGEEPR